MPSLQVHGPFSSEKMLMWMKKGFFQMELEVRGVTSPKAQLAGPPCWHWPATAACQPQVREAGSSTAWSPLEGLLLQMSPRARTSASDGMQQVPQPAAGYGRSSAFSRLDGDDALGQGAAASGGRGGGRRSQQQVPCC